MNRVFLGRLTRRQKYFLDIENNIQNKCGILEKYFGLDLIVVKFRENTIKNTPKFGQCPNYCSKSWGPTPPLISDTFNPIPVHVFRIRATTMPQIKRKRQAGAKLAPGVLE